MCVLYLTNNSNSAGKSGEKVVLKDKGSILTTLPFKYVDGIVVTGNASISTEVVRNMMSKGKVIIYTDWRGNFEGMLHSSRIDRLRIYEQLEAVNDDIRSCKIACSLVSKKICNQVKVLRDYARYRKNEAIKKIADKLEIYVKELSGANNLDTIRGIEGICAKEYFSAWDYLFQGKGIRWQGRNRQPASDSINALLNYGYAFLEREVRVSIAGTGIDERFGFLHSNNGRKDSLVFDLMELFRQPVIDRLILKCFSRKMLKPDDFIKEDEACILTDMGRKKWINIYEQMMQAGCRQKIREEINAFVDKLCRGATRCAG